MANASLLDVHVLDRLKEHPSLTHDKLLAVAAHNAKASNRDIDSTLGSLQSLEQEALFDRMVQEALFKVVVVISGQGPKAFGMPEMFTPMQHINSNRELRKLAALISDGRYSGTSYGAAIGHVAPEAMDGGLIGLLETGDLLRMQLTRRRIDLIDPRAFVAGRLMSWSADLTRQRHDLGADRRQRLVERRRRIAATNRMEAVTDASRGVVPLVVAEEATQTYAATVSES